MNQFGDNERALLGKVGARERELERERKVFKFLNLNVYDPLASRNPPSFRLGYLCAIP